MTRSREGPSGALPLDSQLGDEGGPLSSWGVTVRSINEKTPNWPLEPFSLLLLSWSPQTWGGSPQGQRGAKYPPRLALSGCLGSSPFLRPHYCPGKATTDTHGAMSPQGCTEHISHADAEMKGDLMRFTPSPVSKTQTAVIILVSGVTLLREQATNPQPQGLPAV